jgi:arylsulfatase
VARGLIAAASLLLAQAAGAADAPRPDVVIFLADDLGYSDIGSYGGEIQTPALDALAAAGLRFTQFYVTPRCSPTRAALLTGRDPHRVGFGHLPDLASSSPAYAGVLPADVPTLAELLREAGYATWMSGKWHLSREGRDDGTGPVARGFERFFGVIQGASDYWDASLLEGDGAEAYASDAAFHLTDAIGFEAARFVREHATRAGDEPFFLYVAFTAPHWPLHAHPEDMARYEHVYERGWDIWRAYRMQGLERLGIADDTWGLSERDPRVPSWYEIDDEAWQAARMRAYAAMVDRMDRAVEEVVAALRDTSRLDDTLILFLSDNGASAEELSLRDARLRRVLGLWTPEHYGNQPGVAPGLADTFQSYGPNWSAVSNAPFLGNKADLHEGGISSPLVVHWPGGLASEPGALERSPAQVVDILPTLLELAGAPTPPGLSGESLAPLLRGEARERGPMFWEHEGNRAVRDGRWKLVAPWRGPWELYDLRRDRTEKNDVAWVYPREAKRLAALWDAWAEEAGVVPWPWALSVARWAAGGAAGLLVLVSFVVARAWRRRALKSAGDPGRAGQ